MSKKRKKVEEGPFLRLGFYYKMIYVFLKSLSQVFSIETFVLFV